MPRKRKRPQRLHMPSLAEVEAVLAYLPVHLRPQAEEVLSAISLFASDASDSGNLTHAEERELIQLSELQQKYDARSAGKRWPQRGRPYAVAGELTELLAYTIYRSPMPKHYLYEMIYKLLRLINHNIEKVSIKRHMQRRQECRELWHFPSDDEFDPVAEAEREEQYWAAIAKRHLTPQEIRIARLIT